MDIHDWVEEVLHKHYESIAFRRDALRAVVDLTAGVIKVTGVTERGNTLTVTEKIDGVDLVKVLG